MGARPSVMGADRGARGLAAGPQDRRKTVPPQHGVEDASAFGLLEKVRALAVAGAHAPRRLRRGVRSTCACARPPKPWRRPRTCARWALAPPAHMRALGLDMQDRQDRSAPHLIPPRPADQRAAAAARAGQRQPAPRAGGVRRAADPPLRGRPGSVGTSGQPRPLSASKRRAPDRSGCCAPAPPGARLPSPLLPRPASQRRTPPLPAASGPSRPATRRLRSSSPRTAAARPSCSAASSAAARTPAPAALARCELRRSTTAAR